MTPVFKTKKEVLNACTFFTHGVYINKKLLKEAQVEKVGWYLIRTDLYKLLPIKHCIVRSLPSDTCTKEEREEINRSMNNSAFLQL